MRLLTLTNIRITLILILQNYELGQTCRVLNNIKE